MNNLSNERASDKDIQQIIDSKEKGTAMFMPVDVYYLIAKELKALREAGKEPVAWTDKEELRDAGNGGCGYLFSLNGNANKFSDPRRKIMLYAVTQLPAVPEYPERLPCPVLLEPGLRLGAGIKTSTLLEALARRDEYYVRLNAMTPLEREEHRAGIEAFKSLMDSAIAAAPKPE